MTQTTPLILYPSKVRAISLLLMSLVFSGVGIGMIQNGKGAGWFVTIVFVLCTVVFFLNLLPNAAHLQLNHEGFEERSLFRSHFTYWREVDTFWYGRLAKNETVFFNYVQEPGAKNSLMGTYGKTPGEMAELMNEWKVRFSR